MSKSWNKRWQEVSPYLERALEMPAAEREVWLDALRGDDPALEKDVRALLVEHQVLGQQGFLERMPPFLASLRLFRS